MRVVKYEEVPWTRNNGLRGGTPTGKPGASKGSSLHRRLIKGAPGEPGNFEMIVLWSQQSDEGSSRTFPRHRHTFDQVRLSLSGSPEWIPGVPTPPGCISYVPAGTWYGPYQRYAGHAQLHIQFEGANRYPFTDYGSLIIARDELSLKGSFEGGRYWWVDENGQRQSKDGFEAGQEQATGRKPELPLPRFTTPLNMEPDNFAWVDVEPGVRIKELGRFTERETRLAILRLDGNTTYQFPAPGQTTLFFVTSGSGTAEGQDVGERDSMVLEPQGTGTFSTTSELEIFLLGLPKQDEVGAGA
jgi:hypothetical protein